MGRVMVHDKVTSHAQHGHKHHRIGHNIPQHVECDVRVRFSSFDRSRAGLVELQEHEAERVKDGQVDGGHQIEIGKEVLMHFSVQCFH